jgi:allantoicase
MATCREEWVIEQAEKRRALAYAFVSGGHMRGQLPKAVAKQAAEFADAYLEDEANFKQRLNKR